MPYFQLVPLEEATRHSGANSRRQQLLQEYASFIRNLGPGEAGKLAPSDGETSMAIRRRLTAAAKQLGKEIRNRGHATWARSMSKQRGVVDSPSSSQGRFRHVRTD